MKLLIITQTVDSGDPVLGFFHAWIKEFAGRFESVTVIAQSAGTHVLPSNVTVYDLQKRAGAAPWKQVIRFWSLILRHRHSYDVVFVHMTPVWILLGAPVWLLLRKRMYLWYEIKRGSLKLSAALLFVRKVFAATAQGIPGTSHKLVVTGHGIDTDAFSQVASERDPHMLVTVGRITQVKRFDVLLKAFVTLPAEYTLTIAGGTVTDRDAQCLSGLREFIAIHGLESRVKMGWVAPDAVPALLQHAYVFLHAAEGGLDKALLQAMACGCPVLSSSEAAREELPQECRTTNDRFGERLAKLLALSPEERQRLSEELRSIVLRDHALPQCVERLSRAMQS